MAKEPDQTRWVGIRPTDPSENIPVTESVPLTSIEVEPVAGSANFPVTESAPLTSIEVEPVAGCGNFPVTESTPLTQIKVEPLAVGTEFKTLTQKRSPAIGDMQAVCEMIRRHANRAKGASPDNEDIYTVPAGKIFMVSSLYATYSGTTVSDINVGTIVGITMYPIIFWSHIAGWESHIWFGALPLNEGETVRFTWLEGAAGGTVICALMGYLIDKY